MKPEDPPEIDFLTFSDMYAKMKEAGQLERAAKFMARYKEQVKAKMEKPVVLKGQRSRFDREDPI